MLGKSLLIVVFLIFCLVSVVLPKGLAQNTLAPPSITVPSGWSLAGQTPYPNAGTGDHDPLGCGFLYYNSSQSIILFQNTTFTFSINEGIVVYYENSLGINYSNTQLQTDAENSYNQIVSPEEGPYDSSGVTSYAGVPAGYASAYSSAYGYYSLEIIMVINGCYLDMNTLYIPSDEGIITSMLNSISVPAPAPTPTPTSTPTPTFTPSPTPTVSATPAPTSTPTPTPTASPSPTNTPLPTPAATPTPTSNQTHTASPTQTPTASPSSTSSPQPTPSSSQSSSQPIPSPTPTNSPAHTSSPSSPTSQESSNVTTTVWVPAPQNAAAATVLSVSAVEAVSLIFAAVSIGAATASGASAIASIGVGGRAAGKIRNLVPDMVKKWFEDFVSSKRKLTVPEKMGSIFKPTKSETLAYIISTVFLAFSFSYVKVNYLSQILIVLPTIFATSIIVGFAKTFFSVAYSRRKGVWTEHKVWYLGLVTFIITTFAFRIPFSSPTRTVHCGPKFTERLGAILSSASVLMSLAFAGFFGILLIAGFTVIGGTGLAMCVIGSFFDMFPIEPMSGKAIFSHSRALWICLFALTLSLYASWLLLM